MNDHDRDMVLHRIECKLDHLDCKMDFLIEHNLLAKLDQAQLALLTEKLKASRTALDQAVKASAPHAA